MIATGGLALAVWTAWLALTSDNISVDPWVAAVIRAALIIGPIFVGLYAWRRCPASRYPAILIIWGFATAPIMLNSLSDPFLYTAATIYTAFYVFITTAVFMTYPSGHTETRPERWILIASLPVGALWALSMLVTANPPTLDWFVRCGDQCPENLAFIVDRPELANLLSTASRLATAGIALAVGITLAVRLYRATGPMRRTLSPVVAVYFPTAIAAALYRAAENADVAETAINGLAIAVGVTRALVPWAILLGMIRGQMFVGNALAHLLGELDRHPDPDELEEALAEALNDQSLSVAYWLPDRLSYVDREGQPVELPDQEPGLAVTKVDRETTPVAAIIHDDALNEEPGMVDAVASAALLGLENARLEADLRSSIVELQSSRSRIVAAADEERRRIERDLHDGAQARLVALSIDIELLADLAEENPQLAGKRLAELSSQVEEALEDLRQLAQGIYPPLLEDRGLDDALQAAALRASLPTTVDVGEVGRFKPEVESAVYFCCLEALQNSSKHAGDGAQASIRVWSTDDDLCFEIIDTGIGFDTEGTPEGTGLNNMRIRLGALGGDIVVATSVGSGTSVSGSVRVTGQRVVR